MIHSRKELRRIFAVVGAIATLATGVAMAMSIHAQQFKIQREREKANAIEARAAAILRYLPVAVFICDDNGIVKTCNLEAQLMVNRDENEIVGYKVSSLLPPDMAALHEAGLPNVVDNLRTKPDYQMTKFIEGEVFDREGKRRAVNIRMRGMNYRGEVILMGVGTVPMVGSIDMEGPLN